MFVAADCGIVPKTVLRYGNKTSAASAGAAVVGDGRGWRGQRQPTQYNVSSRRWVQQVFDLSVA
jgi:hypothetical protein